MTIDCSSNEKRQYVWIVRYGLTEYPLVENEGPFDSDIDSNEGIVHAKSIADRMASSGAAAPSVVYASPFLRTVHTAHIIATTTSSTTTTSTTSPCQVRIEEGLTEWQVPSLLVTPDGNRTYPKSAQEHAQKFNVIDTTYQSVNPTTADKKKEGSPQFPETEESLVVRCATTLEAMLAADTTSTTNIAIVSHAPCNIAMALHLEGTTLQTSKHDPWPLGGLTLFSRPIKDDNNDNGSSWKLEFYGCSKHMPGDYQAGLKRWTLPSLQQN